MADPKANIALQLMKDEGITFAEVDSTLAGKKPGEEGYVAPTPKKPGEEGYVEPVPAKKPGDEGYIEPVPAKKPGEEGYVEPTIEKKPGDEGYVAPAAKKPGDEEEEDVDDEKLKKALKKRGIEVDDIEDLKKKEPAKQLTPEEQEQADKEFRENAIKFALNQKDTKIKSADITAYQLDAAKTPRELVYPVITANWKKEDPDLTAEQLEERFAEYYLENKPEDDWMRKERTNFMAAQANAILQNKHANVLGIEGAYANHVETVELATNYNKQVEKIIKTFPLTNKFEIEVDLEGGKKEKMEYTFEFSKDSITAIKDHLLSEEQFDKLGRAKPNDATLTAVIRNTLIEKELQKIVTTVARSHANKMIIANKAGRKGVIPASGGDGTTDVNLPPKRTVAGDLLEENKR